MDDSNKATLYGCIAVVFWSVSAFLTLELNRIPLLQLVALQLLLTFCMTLLLVTIKGRWSRITSQAPQTFALGTLVMMVNQLLYVEAFRLAPVVQVDLIIYLWPVFLMLLIGTFPGRSLSTRHLLAACGALMGLLIAFFFREDGYASASFSHIGGYVCALLSAAIWATYTACSNHYFKGQSPYTLGLCAGLSGSVLWGLHLISGIPSAILEPAERFSIAIIGLGILGCGYALWEAGVKRGCARGLSVLCYFIPVLSLLALVLAGKVEYSHALTLAGGITVLSSFCGASA